MPFFFQDIRRIARVQVNGFPAVLFTSNNREVSLELL